MTALIQNFSIPADNDVAVEINVDPDVNLTTLSGSTVYWNAYPMQFAVPVPGQPPVISYSTTAGNIVLLPSPPPTSCQLKINSHDTVGLLRNYYHETTLVDLFGHKSTLNIGVMTVTESENRP
jgi:hypothetical protein